MVRYRIVCEKSSKFVRHGRKHIFYANAVAGIVIFCPWLCVF